MSLMVYFVIYMSTVLLVSSLSSKSPVEKKCQKYGCKWMGGKYVANCSLKFLESPDYLPRDIKTINLSNNKHTQLNKEEFSKANLENIYEQLMKNCSIEKVDDLAFKGMLIFKNNKGLRRIYLSYNKIKFISGNLFIDVLNVKEIFLDSNEIELVTYSSFGHLTKSGQHNLERNILKFLGSGLVNLNRLTNFNISGNPWVCDCSLDPLKYKGRAIGLDLSRVVCDSPDVYRPSSWSGNWVLDCFPSTVSPKVSKILVPRVFVRDKVSKIYVHRDEIISEENTMSDTTAKDFPTDINILIKVFSRVIIFLTIIVIFGGLVYLFKPKKNSILNWKAQYTKVDDGKEEFSDMSNKSMIANQVVKPPRMTKSAEMLDLRQNQNSEVYSSLEMVYINIHLQDEYPRSHQ